MWQGQGPGAAAHDLPQPRLHAGWRHGRLSLGLRRHPHRPGEPLAQRAHAISPSSTFVCPTLYVLPVDSLPLAFPLTCSSFPVQIIKCSRVTVKKGVKQIFCTVKCDEEKFQTGFSWANVGEDHIFYNNVRWTQEKAEHRESLVPLLTLSRLLPCASHPAEHV